MSVLMSHDASWPISADNLVVILKTFKVLRILRSFLDFYINFHNRKIATSWRDWKLGSYVFSDEVTSSSFVHLYSLNKIMQAELPAYHFIIFVSTDLQS